MYTCPNCRQTIEEKLFAQIDEQKKKENNEQYNNSIKNIKLRIVKEKEYQRIVDEHNEKRTYNISWWGERTYNDDEWMIIPSPSLFICTKSYRILDEYKPIYSLSMPEVLYKYIECPQCNYKNYIK